MPGHTIGPETRVIDAAGRYMTPGLLDAHMHVEFGMVTLTEFVRAVGPRGTTDVCSSCMRLPMSSG